MGLEYVNRRGDRYYIYQGKTKTGKPKYFASKKPTSEKGRPLEKLPDDFEIHEDPSDGRVYVRRRKPSRILAAERDLVHRVASELAGCSSVRTVIDGDCIVVYTPDRDPAEAADRLGRAFGVFPGHLSEWMAQNERYTAELRFTLLDVDLRTFGAERYCYRGAIDDWIPVARPGPLESLARELVPHLGRESFFELI